MNIGYKLFEQDRDGNLYPLFIDKNKPIPMNEWVHAECHITSGFSARPGYHVGLIPDAPWLRSYDGTNTGYYKARWKYGQRVWCEVEYNANHNYNDFVQTLPKKCMQDRIPEDGCYDFREVGKGVWVISSDIKINKVLSEEERQRILRELDYDEIEVFAKYKAAFEKRMRIATA